MTHTLWILGALNNKAKVDGDTLIALSCTLCVGLTMISLAKFCLSTHGTSVQVGGHLDLGDTIGIAMGIGDTMIMYMSKPLVP